MNRPNSHPKIKPSYDWAREAPEGATALIVAECRIKGQSVFQRRVALGWLYGDRNKPAPLREAAAKLPETASLATADANVERKESDGSTSLASSERCQMRWIVRSIPRAILVCWTGFEDGFNQPVPASAGDAPARRQPVNNPPAPPRPDKTIPVHPEVQLKDERMPPVCTNESKPVAPARSIGSVPSDDTRGTPHPTLPQFAPLEALILNVKKAFSGNCAGVDAKFLTDGRMLLLRSACNGQFLAKVKPGEVGVYGPMNPVTESACQKLFDDTIADARYAARISGFVLAASIGIKDDPDEPLACITGPGDRITIVNGHRVKLIQNITGANIIKASVNPKSQRIGLFKDEQPVAVLMAVDSMKVERLFQQILCTRKPLAQLRPDEAAGARKAS